MPAVLLIAFIYIMGFPDVSVVNNWPAMQEMFRRHCFNPWSVTSHRGGNGNPLQYSCLKNPMGRGAWWAIVHGSQKVRHDWTSEHTHTFTEQVYFSVFLIVGTDDYTQEEQWGGKEQWMRKFTLVNGSLGRSQTTRFLRGFGTLNVMWIHPLKLFTQQIFIKHESWADKRDTLKWMDSWSQSNEKI